MNVFTYLNDFYFEKKKVISILISKIKLKM